jgi:phospholipid transport system transporter-binding protein
MMQLPATATLAEASALLAQLDGGADAIDASALQSFDTSAVALLLEAQRRAVSRGARLVVHNAPPKLVELAKLYGVDGLLSLDGSST